MIKIIGLGAGDLSQISFGAVNALKSGLDIYLRTKNHPVVDKLDIEYKSFDSYYESGDTFEQVYLEIAKEVIRLGREKDIVYAVPGHPKVAEMTVGFIEEISHKEGIEIEIIPSMSFLDAMYDFVDFDPVDGFKLIDAFQIERCDLENSSNIIITQVCDRFIASNVKLKLMEYYQDDIEIYIVKAAGVKDLEEKKKVFLYDMDNIENDFDNLTSIFIQKGSKKKYFGLYDAIEQIKQNKLNSSEKNIEQQYQDISKKLEQNIKEIAKDIEIQDIDRIIENSSDIISDILEIGLLGEKQGYFDIWEIIDLCKKRNNQ